MKTTIKSFLVAAVAATTLFSCSNEIESFEGVVPGNPGDVQISIGLGGGGATTYSTTALEGAIKSGSARLYKKNSIDSIALKNAKIEGNKFTATVSADDVADNKEARLCIYVNGVITPKIPANYDDMKAATIATELNRELTNGIPASLDTIIPLVGGTPITGELRLKRVAARVGAESANATSINEYKIELIDVNTASGKLFPGDAAGAVAPTKVTVAHTLNGTTTGMFKGETVGYVYPSTGSSIKVTPATGKGDPKTVSFAPKANKNYTVKITPMVTQDGTFDNTITIVEWDKEGIDIPVDMNPEKLLATVAIEPSAAPNFEKYKDGVSVKASYTNDRMDIQNLVERQPNGTLGVLNVELVTTFAAADAPTAENPLSIKTSTDSQSTVFGIATFATPRAEVKKTLKVTYAVESGASYVRYLHIYLEKYETNVEKLLVNIGGNLWMPFNTSGSAINDEALAGEILRTNGATIAEKTANYAYASVANFKKIQGKYTRASTGVTSCPTGYTNANLAAWEALAGNAKMPQNAGTHWCATGVAQEFANSILSRVSKTGIVGGDSDLKKMNFYTIFTAKAQLGATAGTVLPFIGNGWGNGEGMTPGVDILGGMVIWGGDRSGANYTRMAVWNDGVYYHYTPNPATDIANVRCIKIK